MKEIVCIVPFGNCEVGDVREVEDDAQVSPIYFALKEDLDEENLPVQLYQLRQPNAKDATAKLAQENEQTGPVVETRGDTPDAAEEKALAGAKKAPAKKATSAKKDKASDADEDLDKNEG